MQQISIIIFILISSECLWLFLRKDKFSPLWLMLSAWFVAIGIAQLRLSTLEKVWGFEYWYLLTISLLTFALGYGIFKKVWESRSWWQNFKFLVTENLSTRKLRILIYGIFAISLVGLYLFYKKAGTFPLLAQDPDAFRFIADDKVPGLINYCAQLARIFIPLSFFLMFYEGFDFRKHWDLIITCLIGILFIIVFASRTQIFFIDLWVMALYLLMRKPGIKQALKFYPVFLLVSVLVLAAVPIYRQYRSYGEGYLAGVTGINTQGYNFSQKAFMPIYVGVAFNQQALLHAHDYYKTHEIQKGKVSLDPFTNIFGKIITPLNNYKSEFDLGAIFYSWWNTGTYLFPFVQDFGTAAFYFVPIILAALVTLAWKYWQKNPNFLSINLYAYTIFFIVMTVYLSFTVRAEMYLDLMLLLVCHFFVSHRFFSNAKS